MWGPTLFGCFDFMQHFSNSLIIIIIIIIIIKTNTMTSFVKIKRKKELVKYVS
jgi:hypothetical protein